MKARKEAQQADIVVVNHHLFFADVVLKDSGVAELCLLQIRLFLTKRINSLQLQRCFLAIAFQLHRFLSFAAMSG